MDVEEIVGLVHSARAGDQRAWNTIVDQYANLVWAVVRRFRLNDAQSADAVQTTWLRLVEHLDDIRDPERIAGWIATTGRRVCLEMIRDGQREYLVDPYDQATIAVTSRRGDPEPDGPESTAVRTEEQGLVRTALATLEPRDQQLLRLLSSPHDVSYREISVRLGMPIGSIGPTRARALERLRCALRAEGLIDADR